MGYKGDQTPTTQHELSKKLLGRTDRVAIWAKVLGYEPPRFTQLDLQAALDYEQGINRDTTRLEVKTMRETGMVRQCPVEGGGEQDFYYERTDSPLWEVAAAAVRAFGIIFPDTKE